MAVALEREQVFKLAKVVGIATIMASAVANEYGVTINLASVQSVSLYPRVEALAPWAMMLAGVLLLPKVLLYMRFSRVMPRAGSFYVWIGRTLGMPVGFVLGFLNWVSLTAAMGLVAYAFGTFLGPALVSAGVPAGAWFTTSIGHLVLGLAALWTIYLVHASGVTNFGKLVQFVFWVIVAIVLGMVLIGFTTSSAHFVALASQASHTALHAPLAPAPPTFGAVIATAGLFVAAYGGLNAATALGGEARNSTSTTPRGLLWGWLAAVILYSAVLLAIFHAVPWWSITELTATKYSALATAPGLIGLVAPHVVGIVLGLVVALVVGKTLAPIMMVSSRSLFAWGEDGVVSARVADTNVRKAPTVALFICAALASVFLVQSTFIGWEIGLVIRSVVILLVMIAVAVGVFATRFRPALRERQWARSVGAGWSILVLAGLAIIIGAVLLVGVAITPKTPWEFQPLFQGAVATLIAIAIYWSAHVKSRREGHRLHAVGQEPPLE